MSSEEKIMGLQQRITDAEDCYQKALVSFGTEKGDIDQVTTALRALWAAKADLECEQVRQVCETVKFGGQALFEQMENLPVM
jgi:hypothetical protein